MFTTAAAIFLGALLGATLSNTTQRSTMFSSLKARLFGSRKRKVVTVASSLVLIAATTALAAWLISAKGPGTGKVGSLVAPTVSAGTAPTSGILPAGTGDARFSIQNPNSVDLIITSIKEDSSSGMTTWIPDPGSTPPADTVTIPTQTGLSIPVPKSATTTITVPNGFKLASEAPTMVQGLSFQRRAELTFSTP